jgi:hypothetical protein
MVAGLLHNGDKAVIVLGEIFVVVDRVVGFSQAVFQIGGVMLDESDAAFRVNYGTCGLGTVRVEFLKDFEAVGEGLEEFLPVRERDRLIAGGLG